jgi:ATP-dependent protease HslVU (ClpYQ) ATPase subunit
VNDANTGGPTQLLVAAVAGHSQAVHLRSIDHASEQIGRHFSPRGLTVRGQRPFPVARRLYTIMERLLEELSFAAPDMGRGDVNITEAYVKDKLESLSQDEDLSKFIL